MGGGRAGLSRTWSSLGKSVALMF
ncbi:hypothetical protein BRAO375_840002 [Bradyrhizobium sp. ORS 375]|nr:hypothetical protein BRAO375_840002 [Bradyrhizobium sp. ORS 375]